MKFLKVNPPSLNKKLPLKELFSEYNINPTEKMKQTLNITPKWVCIQQK